MTSHYFYTFLKQPLSILATLYIFVLKIITFVFTDFFE